MSIKVVLVCVFLIILTGCMSAPCPEGTEDLGLGQCVEVNKPKK